MLEIRIHGRGGQGAQVGCQILAGAFFKTGRWVQAFAAYGGERRGAPVTAYLRVDERPIRVRSDIERPHHIIVLDATLLDDSSIVASLRPGGWLFVNAPLPGVPPWNSVRVVTVDATAIALRRGLSPVVSTTMLGAFAGASGLVPLEKLVEAVREGSPARAEENIAACVEAYWACAGLEAIGA
ncbi:MAG: 2-oxoacid:acceptor oxidoreductase family protein [Candidatus Rokubacteria bacterium]|nr:2-oxoacid:acceptor oxidoreductase family protein [Candidatus Rokubacteria bacterium]